MRATALLCRLRLAGCPAATRRRSSVAQAYGFMHTCSIGNCRHSASRSGRRNRFSNRMVFASLEARGPGSAPGQKRSLNRPLHSSRSRWSLRLSALPCCSDIPEGVIFLKVSRLPLSGLPFGSRCKLGGSQNISSGVRSKTPRAILNAPSTDPQSARHHACKSLEISNKHP